MILVFGSDGQLGRELLAMGSLDATAMVGLPHARADIADPAAVARAFAEHDPRIVINAAAYNAVDRAESEPEAARRTNTIGPAILAAAAAGSRVPLIHVSTDYVFDGAKAGAYVETDPIHPLGAYGRSKADGEKAVRVAHPAHLIVRTAWLFGIHGSNFLKTMVKLAGERAEIDVVADQRGSPTSTYDLARALLTAALAIGRGRRPWGTYHFAGSGETTRYEFAAHIVAAQGRFTGGAPAVRAVASADRPTPARRPANSVLDSSKFAATFGYHAADWREAVDRTVAQLFAQRSAA